MRSRNRRDSCLQKSPLHCPRGVRGRPGPRVGQGRAWVLRSCAKGQHLSNTCETFHAGLEGMRGETFSRPACAASLPDPARSLVLQLPTRVPRTFQSRFARAGTIHLSSLRFASTILSSSKHALQSAAVGGCLHWLCLPSAAPP